MVGSAASQDLGRYKVFGQMIFSTKIIYIIIYSNWTKSRIINNMNINNIGLIVIYTWAKWPASNFFNKFSN